MDSQFSLRGSGRRLQKEEGDEELLRKLWYGGDGDDVDVDFWRSTAGWADDDVSMVQYNHAVYNQISEGDGDYDNGSRIWTSKAQAVSHTDTAHHHPFVLMGALAAVLFCLFMFCCCAISKKDKRSNRKKKKVAAKMKRMKGSSRELTDKLGERRSRSSSRSRARSESRSREGASEKVSDDYQLIDGGESSKRRDSDDKSSSRARSKSRSKSRSDGKSRSKSSTRERVDVAENEKVLNESACDNVE